MRRPALAAPLAVLVLAALASSACRRPQGPAEQYRAFTAAARAGDADQVWSMLSERSRALLDARATQVAARAPAGVVASSGREVVLGDLASSAARVESVVVSRESRDAAVLAVRVAGRPDPEQVSLVREGGAWRVVLPAAAPQEKR
jgi:hypothetical protein